MDQRSIFLEDMYAEIFANYGIVKTGVTDLIAEIPLHRRCDLLIITPSVFEAQANQLARWKREKGFITRVVTLDTIESARGGTSANDIRAYIKNIYLCSNLSYVLLLGDAEFIPVHYVTPDPGGYQFIATDLYYAEMDDEGYLPDLGIGRLPVDTNPCTDPEFDPYWERCGGPEYDPLTDPEHPADPLAEVQRVVDKIIAYEKNPPSCATGFYGRILHVACFEDDWGGSENPDVWVPDGRAEKWYVETMEEIRDFFLWEGYPHLPRVYDTGKVYWTPDCELETCPGPRKYSDGTLLPVEIRWPDCLPEFTWDGNAEDIMDELDEDRGAFLLLYRGHGGKTGWTGPRFYKSSYAFDPGLPDLINGNKTPVTLSFTCLTGFFDNETLSVDPSVIPNYKDESFAEVFLRMEGGSVAVVAATRESSGLSNNHLIRGFIDCIWNDMLPGFPGVEDSTGGGVEGTHRLGDALNYAKFYLNTQIACNPALCQRMFEVYHLLGDPTMEIWTACPYVTFIPMDPQVYQPIRPYEWRYSFPMEMENVLVSLIQKGEVLAQAMPKEGWVELNLDSPLPYSSDTFISFARKGYLTKVLPIKLIGDEPAPGFGSLFNYFFENQGLDFNYRVYGGITPSAPYRSLLTDP